MPGAGAPFDPPLCTPLSSTKLRKYSIAISFLNDFVKENLIGKNHI